MEEVRRVTSTKKTKKSTKILLIIAGVLGLALIGTAMYFYAIGETSKQDVVENTTCACYYIDPNVISECGDPRRGFMFELNTVPGDQVCQTTCSTDKLSTNLLNSSTEKELYQICTIPKVQDTRCTSMTIKDSTGKTITGEISASEEITIGATFDSEYTDHKFVINNEDTEPDIVSSDKLTIEKTLTEISGSAISITATATDNTGDQISSIICRRMLDVNQENEPNVTTMRIDTRTEEETQKVSSITIGVGNITEQSNLRITFSFDNNLPDLLMTSGFTLDPDKGELTIIEQDLYDSENFNTDTNFTQLNEADTEVTITAQISNTEGTIGTVSGSVDFSETASNDGEQEEETESNFEVSKTSNLECVERVAPSNVTQFTITTINKTNISQNISNVKDKLPLGFSYVTNSTKINGVSVTDSEYITTEIVGESQEVLWEKTDGWPVPSGQSLVIVFQAEVGEDALTGENQNEVVVTPEEVPEDPETLRAEYVIEVAQSCDGEETPTPPDDEEQDSSEESTPDTGLLDSILVKAVLGIITIFIGWYIYSKPQGQVLTEKLVESGMYKEAELFSWRIFKPKKYFEEKLVKELRRKKD